MICYRAETAFSNSLSIGYKASKDQIRALVKSIIFNKADILPDYKSGTLTVQLYALSTPRENRALNQILKDINETETVYPGSDLTLYFKNCDNLS